MEKNIGTIEKLLAMFVEGKENDADAINDMVVEVAEIPEFASIVLSMVREGSYKDEWAPCIAAVWERQRYRVECDLSALHELLIKLVDQKEPVALIYATMFYGTTVQKAKTEVGSFENIDQALRYVEWITKCEDESVYKELHDTIVSGVDMRIQYFVGQCYRTGDNGFSKDWEKAKEYFAKAGEQDYWPAIWYLAILQGASGQNDEMYETLKRLIYWKEDDGIDYIFDQRDYPEIADQTDEMFVEDLISDHISYKIDSKQVTEDDCLFLIKIIAYSKENNPISYARLSKKWDTKGLENIRKILQQSKICKRCGAVNPKDSMICAKCGEILEIKGAADIEKLKTIIENRVTATQRATENSAETDRVKLKRAYDYFRANAKAYNDYNRLCAQKQIYDGKKPSKAMGCGVALGILFGGGMMIPLVFAYVLGEFGYVFGLIACVIGAIVAYVLINKKEEERIYNNQYDIDYRLKNAEKDIVKIYNGCPGGCPVHLSYSHPGTIRYLCDLMDNGRADTIKEAINLMETELHRYRMEHTQQHILFRTAQTAQYAKAATFLSAVDLLSRR